MNQTFKVSGSCGHKGSSYGSQYKDKTDFCDGQDINSNGPGQEMGCYSN